MVKVEDIEVMGWRKAIKGMRNAMNSWDRMDSGFCTGDKCFYTSECWNQSFKGKEESCPLREYDEAGNNKMMKAEGGFAGYILGPNDLDLACRLIKAGPEHRKFLRMIHIQMDITGPLYWWKEMDTYKVATVENSCSTMHRIHAKEFELSDFSYDRLDDFSLNHLNETIKYLNSMRTMFLLDKNRHYWWQLIQLLPSSYNQLRTWDGSMETVLSILHQRAHHKLDTDWEPFRQACFNNIPYCKEFYEAMYGKEEN